MVGTLSNPSDGTRFRINYDFQSAKEIYRFQDKDTQAQFKEVVQEQGTTVANSFWRKIKLMKSHKSEEKKTKEKDSGTNS